MRQPSRRTIARGWLTLALGLAAGRAGAQVAPQAPGFDGTASTRYAAFRPAFDLPHRRPLVATGYEIPTRPVFFRGYSGYNYGRGPREAFIPTGCGTGVVQAVGTTFTRPAGTCSGLFGRKLNW